MLHVIKNGQEVSREVPPVKNRHGKISRCKICGKERDIIGVSHCGIGSPVKEGKIPAVYALTVACQDPNHGTQVLKMRSQLA
jgi:hypothetical protein